MIKPILISAFLILPLSSSAAESICFGTPSQGRLQGGTPIPESGANFSAYSSLGVSLGRTYVHSKVARVISTAYQTLARSQASQVYVYGESGWENGGQIKPHRTHQNGLAVDFMVPVLDSAGRSVPLPTGVTNKFGYDIEFDKNARYDGLSIDFEAIAEHLYALHGAARQNGVGVARVIFEPGFLPRLYKTKRGSFIKQHINFMKTQAWVRHDEHYHIDFAFPCRAL